MTNTIWIFSIEPIVTRYTIDWHKHFPELLRNELDYKVVINQIDGDTMPGNLENGEFLDFVSTNLWKNEQAIKFFRYVKSGQVQKGDQIIFMDAWNPIIPQIKYVNDLRNMNWTLHGLFHAGSYDEHDFLGRLIGNKPWVRHTEKAFFHALDHNYFATEFHANMFIENLLNTEEETITDHYDLDTLVNDKKIILTGWPFEYLKNDIKFRESKDKSNVILFPHRLAPEKQLDIFMDLAMELPQYEWVVCQDVVRSKKEYHELLMQSKMVFSANLQETYGISSCVEGPMAGALPFVPDRLSYSEIFNDYRAFLYPSEWTTSYESYMQHKETLISKIVVMMNYYDEYANDLKEYVKLQLPIIASFNKAITILSQ